MKKRWYTRDELRHEVVLRHREGLSHRAIARALKISRNTVKKLLREHEKTRQEPHKALEPRAKRAPRPKKTDDYVKQVNKLLGDYDDITAQRVFEELRDSGYDGGVTAVQDLVRELRPKPKPEPSLQTPDWGPGKMAESDWTTYTLTFTRTGRHKVQVFGYILAQSKRKYFEAYEGYGVHDLMNGHVGAFERFGGCAARCKYDGQKAVAIRWEGSQPIYNPRFLAFCTHYEMRPWAIRGNPNMRPSIERAFWEVERSFLNGRRFQDLADFRQQMRQWLDRTVDHRKRKGSTALERFQQEAPHLVPLPRHPYDTARVVYHVCSIDGFVEYRGNRYAVPYDHVTDLLPLRITQRELLVYAADLTCIARHELAPRGAGQQLDPRGFHHRHRKAATIDLDQLRDVYQGMGQGACDFFKALSAAPARQWGHQARRILLLRKRYDTGALDAALGHAVRYGALRYESVQRILEARHRPRTLDEYVAAETAERLEALLGTRRTEVRDLGEYDRLPGTETGASDDQKVPTQGEPR